MIMELPTDGAAVVRERLSLVVVSGLQGLVLDVAVLWLFFGLRFSFWVAMGLPVSFMGGVAVMGLVEAFGILPHHLIHSLETPRKNRRVRPGRAAVDFTGERLVGPLAGLSNSPMFGPVFAQLKLLFAPADRVGFCLSFANRPRLAVCRQALRHRRFAGQICREGVARQAIAQQSAGRGSISRIRRRMRFSFTACPSFCKCQVIHRLAGYCTAMSRETAAPRRTAPRRKTTTRSTAVGIAWRSTSLISFSSKISRQPIMVNVSARFSGRNSRVGGRLGNPVQGLGGDWFGRVPIPFHRRRPTAHCAFVQESCLGLFTGY